MDREALDERLARILADAILRELRAEDAAVQNEGAPALTGETRPDGATETPREQHTARLQRAS